MKIIHFALFVSSSSVMQFLVDRGVDPDIVYLNDYKFMKSVFKILVSLYPFNNVDVHLRVPPQCHTRLVFKVRLC